MKSNAPSSRLATSASWSEVTTITGIRANSGDSFSSRSTTMPDITGMIRSSRISEMSSARFFASASASWPLEA